MQIFTQHTAFQTVSNIQFNDIIYHYPHKINIKRVTTELTKLCAFCINIAKIFWIAPICASWYNKSGIYQTSQEVSDMKKATQKYLCLMIALILMIGSASVIPVSASAATVSQKNIVSRADWLYDTTWTAKKDVTGWRYTFSKGGTYHIPYSQPVYTNGYIGFCLQMRIWYCFVRGLTNILS